MMLESENSRLTCFPEISFNAARACRPFQFGNLRLLLQRINETVPDTHYLPESAYRRDQKKAT
jgi:hypothetical protein